MDAAWLHGGFEPATAESAGADYAGSWISPADASRLGVQLARVGKAPAGPVPSLPFAPKGARTASDPLAIEEESGGFVLTGPADPTERVIRIFLAAAQSRILVTAKLSGGEAQYYADTSFASNEAAVRTYTFNYAAARRGETLTIEVRLMHARGPAPRLYVLGLSRPATRRNIPPVVSLTNPRPHAYFETPQRIAVEANPADDTGIARVEFYDRSLALKLGEVARPPYRIEVERHEAWSGAFSARAYDLDGRATDSAPTLYTVVDPGAPRTPVTPPVSHAYPSAAAPVAGWAAAASLAELPNGDVIAAWYSGSYELSADTRISAATYSQTSRSWLPPVVIIREPNVALGNPVLFYHDGVLWCFFVKVFGNAWEFARLHYRQSRDSGRTWAPDVAVPQPQFRYPTGTMPATRPLALRNGDLLVPLNREAYDPEPARQWYSLFLLSSDGGKTWQETAPLFAGAGNIQPAVEQLDDGSLIAFFRPRGLRKFLWVSRSRDNGRTWDPLVASNIPNPSARIGLGRLKNGHLVMALNDDPVRRTPLKLALSTDGGKSWPVVRTIESGGFCYTYPFLLVTRNDEIHVVYDDNRHAIKHAVVDEAWFSARK